MALSIDGSVTNTTAGTQQCTATISTSNSNDVIILWARSAGTASGVSTVSGGGLTWVQRKAKLGTAIDLELWYAIAATPLSSQTITVTWNAVNGANRVTIFGISGANTTTPFDTNASLPAEADSASSASQSVTISTNNANTMLIAGLTANVAFGTLTRAAGFSQVLATGTVNDYSDSIVSSTQSSVTETFSWSGTASENILMVDAIQQASTTTRIPDFMPFFM